MRIEILMLMQRTYRESIFLLLFSVLVMTLFSTCSPLYPLNPWDDANVYMTIGNAMLGGRELYVDIFDHKGPVLFFLHEAAAVLSRNSFIGIYIVQVVSCFFYLRYSLRTMHLFSSSSFALPLVCLLGIVTYSSDFFCYGDSVEEFTLPLYAHCLYYMLRFVKDDHVPRWWQSFSMGIGAALIFWMKFNLLFFYVGGVMALLYIAWRHKTLKELGTIVHWVLGGMAAVTAFVLGYFAVHGTLDALWESYFMINIFHYHGVATNGEPDVWWFPFLKLAIGALLMLPVVFLRVSKQVKLLVFGTYGVLVLSFATLTVQFYYFLVLFVFFPLLINYIRDYVPSVRAYLAMAFIAIAEMATNWNLVTLSNGTFPVSVLEMAEIINANESEDSEVLTFSSYDTGIYQHTRHLPPNKNYFLSSILDPEIKEEQAEWVASGKVKYLVREIGAVNTCHDYYDVPVPDNYHLIYDKEELFRYRFIWVPHYYLWNLTWTRSFLKYIMDPAVVNQRMQVYERRP